MLFSCCVLFYSFMFIKMMLKYILVKVMEIIFVCCFVLFLFFFFFGIETGFIYATVLAVLEHFL